MNNIVWHNRLSDIDADLFIISKDLNSAGSKHFAHIKMSSLADLIRKTPKDQRVYYERIHPDKRQKPFFDIDGTKSTGTKFNETEFLNKYLNSIDLALGNKGIYENYRLIVCSSSTDTKISYHIVIDGVYVSNIVDNRKFCTDVIKIFNKKYRTEDCLIDNAVYTRNRMFRLLYCHKYKAKDRVKRMISYVWNNKICDYKSKSPGDNLLLSMVSHVDKTVTARIEYKEKTESIGISTLSAELESYDLKILYDMYCQFAKSKKMNVMEMRKSNNGTIQLLRTKSSLCIICNRHHSRENAYLIVRRGQLLYKCYRNNIENKLIGNLDSDDRDDEDIFIDDDEDETNTTQ